MILRLNNDYFLKEHKLFDLCNGEVFFSQVRIELNIIQTRGLHRPGPGPARPDPARGPGLGAQIMFGSGPGSNNSNQRFV
jgi:hypothetical protein